MEAKSRKTSEVVPSGHIMIVDDEPDIRESLAKFFRLQNYQVQAFSGHVEACRYARAHPVDLCISDLLLKEPFDSDENGLVLLKKLKQINPDIAVIIMTGYGSIDTAIEAIQSGAFHYLEKPLQFKEVQMLAQRAIEHRKLHLDNHSLKQSLNQKYSMEHFIGQSSKMQKVFQDIEKMAVSNHTVILRGANGTGKELVAKALHYQSRRRDQRLLSVNCAAVPTGMMENELFGHEKGAFTGAERTTLGRFEQANGGTLFLDEIGEIDYNLQGKLLRALSEKTFFRVGPGGQEVSVDVRVICATNRNLEQAISQGKFREDLFYRLNVLSITLPSLHERPEDIPLLASHFLAKENAQHQKNIPGFTVEGMDYLQEYSWPGNVRQLENMIAKIVVLHEYDRDIEVDDIIAALPDNPGRRPARPAPTLSPEGIDLPGELERLERQYIRQALLLAAGNKNKAAELLGLKRTTLVEKIRKYGGYPDLKALEQYHPD